MPIEMLTIFLHGEAEVGIWGGIAEERGIFVESLNSCLLWVSSHILCTCIAIDLKVMGKW